MRELNPSHPCAQTECALGSIYFAGGGRWFLILIVLSNKKNTVDGYRQRWNCGATKTVRKGIPWIHIQPVGWIHFSCMFPSMRRSLLLFWKLCPLTHTPHALAHTLTLVINTTPCPPLFTSVYPPYLQLCCLLFFAFTPNKLRVAIATTLSFNFLIDESFALVGLSWRVIIQNGSQLALFVAVVVVLLCAVEYECRWCVVLYCCYCCCLSNPTNQLYFFDFTALISFFLSLSLSFCVWCSPSIASLCLCPVYLSVCPFFFPGCLPLPAILPAYLIHPLFADTFDTDLSCLHLHPCDMILDLDHKQLPLCKVQEQGWVWQQPAPPLRWEPYLWAVLLLLQRMPETHSRRGHHDR